MTGTEGKALHPLAKLATGIAGFDNLSRGGLPRHRTSLIIGGPGAGKTVFALQCIVNAARQSGERNRALTIVKSRGTWHSNQVRELVLSKSELASYADENVVRNLSSGEREKKLRSMRSADVPDNAAKRNGNGSVRHGCRQ